MPPKNKKSEIPSPPNPPPGLSTIPKESKPLPDLPQEESAPTSTELPQIGPSASPQFEPMPMQEPEIDPGH